jgi:hypothetical protein
VGQKIAVAVVHGVGKQDPDFAAEVIQELGERFARERVGGKTPPVSDLVLAPVYWAPVLQDREEDLWKRVKRGGELDFTSLRQFLVDFAADGIAYQPLPRERDAYDGIHAVFAEALGGLAAAAGARAPLALIAHSLGSVITSNYLYDLQDPGGKNLIAASVRAKMGDTPLERGETLAALYTLGSPLALWSLRYPDFGLPIAVPSPRLGEHHPSLVPLGEWLNFYDEDDVLAYPLRTLNAAYRRAVKADRPVNAGGVLTSWTPFSHQGYWTDDDVTAPIARTLARLWRAVNPT